MHDISTLRSQAERVRQIAWLLTDELTVTRLLAYADELEAKEQRADIGERIPA